MPELPIIPIILGALPEIALALGLTVLVFAVAYLINAIGQAIGSIHLPVIDIDIPIGRYFDVAASGVVNIINSLAQPFAHPLAAWLIAADYSTVGVAQDQLNVAEHQATQIAHLHNVTIPDERAAAEHTAALYTDTTVQGVRSQVHDAQLTWEQAHSLTDAATYINLERAAPSVEHAELALAARTLISSGHYTDTATHPLTDYLDGYAGRLHDAIGAQINARVAPIEGAIAIPRGAAIPNLDVQDLLKAGELVTVGAAIAVIATKIVDCLVSNCAGNNNFNKLLQDALGVVSLAEFVVFLQALVETPTATVTGYIGQAGTVATGHEQHAADVWAGIESALGL